MGVKIYTLLVMEENENYIYSPADVEKYFNSEEFPEEFTSEYDYQVFLGRYFYFETSEGNDSLYTLIGMSGLATAYELDDEDLDAAYSSIRNRVMKFSFIIRNASNELNIDNQNINVAIIETIKDLIDSGVSLYAVGQFYNQCEEDFRSKKYNCWQNSFRPSFFGPLYLTLFEFFSNKNFDAVTRFDINYKVMLVRSIVGAIREYGDPDFEHIKTTVKSLVESGFSITEQEFLESFFGIKITNS